LKPTRWNRAKCVGPHAHGAEFWEENHDYGQSGSLLAARPEVDAERLAVIGVCFGGNYAVHAAADDPLIRAVTTVTPHFRNAEADALWLGGEATVAARLARGREAKAKCPPPPA
jgi:dienelactone hydrolase